MAAKTVLTGYWRYKPSLPCPVSIELMEERDSSSYTANTHGTHVYMGASWPLLAHVSTSFNTLAEAKAFAERHTLGSITWFDGSGYRPELSSFRRIQSSVVGRLGCACGLHGWVGCRCRRCGAFHGPQHHKWRDCVCQICGQSKLWTDPAHAWLGCVCVTCGQSAADTKYKHVYATRSPQNSDRCLRCGSSYAEIHATLVLPGERGCQHHWKTQLLANGHVTSCTRCGQLSQERTDVPQ